MRIISLCPSNTELVHYLGLSQYLVGVDDYSDWPNSIKSLPKLGPDLNINIDLVESLKPDLVLASLSVPGMEKNIEQLKKRHLPFVTYNPQSLQDIKEDLLHLGMQTGHEEKAHELAETFNNIINTYKEIASSIENKPSIYWEWWPKPVFTPGRVNWLTEISELAGGRNIFVDQDVANYQTDWENVKSRNPDHICLIWVGVKESKMNKKALQKRPGWNDLSALQENNVHILEESLFCRPSPRLLIGLQKIAALLHPSKYPVYEEESDPLQQPKKA